MPMQSEHIICLTTKTSVRAARSLGISEALLRNHLENAQLCYLAGLQQHMALELLN